MLNSSVERIWRWVALETLHEITGHWAVDKLNDDMLMLDWIKENNILCTRVSPYMYFFDNQEDAVMAFLTWGE